MILERAFAVAGILIILAATLLTCAERADAWLPAGEPVEVLA